VKFILRTRSRAGFSRSYIVLLDEQDGHLMRSSAWTIIRGRSGAEYCRRKVGGVDVHLSHEVLKVSRMDDAVVGYRNGNTLDCRRANLQLVTLNRYAGRCAS
jgi:hypothetical protein